MKQAKYQYIVDDILTQMTDNSLRPGDKLPSQRVLAQQYRVNRYTIIEAFDILELRCNRSYRKTWCLRFAVQMESIC